MDKQLTFSEIITNIVEPSQKVPLVKFMPSYPNRVKDLEEVVKEVLAGDEMAVLSYLNDCFKGELLECFLQGMQAAYEDTLERYQTKKGILDIDMNFTDGLEAVYCFINKLPASVTNRANAVRYFMSNNIESKLCYLIVAYGVSFLVRWAFTTKGIVLSKRKPRLRASFECQQCGRCCLKYGACLCATDEDIELWERTGRQDILEWIGMLLGELPDLWINPSTGEEASRCPFLRKLPGKNKYICRIYNAKPEICREYPVNKKQVLEDGCPGLKD